MWEGGDRMDFDAQNIAELPEDARYLWLVSNKLMCASKIDSTVWVRE
jgi:hypothetical protein